MHCDSIQPTVRAMPLVTAWWLLQALYYVAVLELPLADAVSAHAHPMLITHHSLHGVLLHAACASCRC